MAGPYSLDLRVRVAAAVTAGLSCRAAAAKFSVGVATVVRWAKTIVRRAARRPCRWAGRQASVCSRPGARLGAGAGARTARPHFAGVDGGARRTRRDRELVWGVAFPETRGVQLQKKACAPPSKTAPRWRDDAPNGGGIKAGLIRGGWSSSMRPAPRPI